MKLLITGARGNFATALINRLLPAEHELVLLDLEPMNEPDGCTAIQADIRDAAAVQHAMQGCEAVIHAVAYHTGAIKSRNYDDYFSVNVTGTHNVLRAMLLNNVRALVFSSSDSVYGDGLRGRHLIDESTPCIPNNIYGMTKWQAEEWCRYYARKHHFNIALLRYGCFLPTDWKTAGLGRLGNWLDREDVAQANEAALGAVVAEAFHCEAFHIHSARPFTEFDWPELESDPNAVVEKYYPGATALLAEHGMTIPHIHHAYDIHSAVTRLGYDPQHNFDQFLSEVRHR